MNLLIGYAAGLLPAIAHPVWRVVAITGLSWSLGAIIFVGISSVGRRVQFRHTEEPPRHTA